MSKPTRPEGVTLHTDTGAHPVSLEYVGVRDDGLHVWHADTILNPDQVLRITVDILPAKTMVMLPLRGTQ